MLQLYAQHISNSVDGDAGADVEAKILIG